MPSVQPIQQQLLIVRGPLFHKLIISASPASISELFASAISKINTFTRGSCSFPLFIQYALKIIRKQLNKYLEMKPQSTSKTIVFHQMQHQLAIIKFIIFKNKTTVCGGIFFFILTCKEEVMRHLNYILSSMSH